jgi:DNA adenine methylase
MIDMLKPPIARMGGKSRLRKQLIGMFPEEFICYVEPFFGAGWVFFGKEPSQVEVINDIDGELVNMFRMIKYHSKEVERLLQYEISSRDTFNEYKNIDVENMTEIQRAVRFIYVISQSFASKGTVYGYGTTKSPAPQIFNTNLNELKARLRNTYVENLNYESIIKKYDREHTLFFCDPPYLETDGYKYKFELEDHIKLSDMLKSIKGKFILTINDHPKIRELYNGFNIIEAEVMYSVSRQTKGRKNFKELIITNYIDNVHLK